MEKKTKPIDPRTQDGYKFLLLPPFTWVDEAVETAGIATQEHLRETVESLSKTRPIPERARLIVVKNAVQDYKSHLPTRPNDALAARWAKEVATGRDPHGQLHYMGFILPLDIHDQCTREDPRTGQLNASIIAWAMQVPGPLEPRPILVWFVDDDVWKPVLGVSRIDMSDKRFGYRLILEK